ncbi:MAG: hypothetical protein ACSLFQ_19210 [Thermoanaerobaculia bacterium]
MASTTQLFVVTGTVQILGQDLAAPSLVQVKPGTEIGSRGGIENPIAAVAGHGGSGSRLTNRAERSSAIQSGEPAGGYPVLA